MATKKVTRKRERIVDRELIRKFREELEKERRRHPKLLKIETAFVHWYVKTRFGKDCKYKVTDGKDDGCIDAIVEKFGADKKKEVYVIQSKFCEEIFKSPNKNPSALDPFFYSDFDKLPDIFKNQEEFEKYLETVETSLHDDYKRLSRMIQRNGSNVVWELTTLHSRSRAGEYRSENIDLNNIRYFTDNLRLYELRLEGAAPPADRIGLNFKEAFTISDSRFKDNFGVKINTHVLSVRAKDFIDYLDRDPRYQLLARNVRGEIRKSEINPLVTKTFVYYPEEFWYRHNGVTMICDKAIIQGKKIVMYNPSVINGAQTLYALKKARRRSSRAYVLVRAVEIPPEATNTKDFINNIILSTNLQNKMYKYNLRANDPTQVELAEKFNEKRVFYERKIGEWDKQRRYLKNQGFSYLNLKKLAQIIVACEQDLEGEEVGVVLAKRSIEDLFSDEYYALLFNRPFKEIYFKYRLYDFVLDCFYDIESKRIKPRERRHALLTCSAIAWSCIEESGLLRSWYDSIERSPGKLSIEKKSCEGLFKTIRELFFACWTRWRKENRKDQTLSPNNFFKSSYWNKKLMKQFTRKFRGKIQRAVQKALK